jgi:hypothetical protein
VHVHPKSVDILPAARRRHYIVIAEVITRKKKATPAQ